MADITRAAACTTALPMSRAIESMTLSIRLIGAKRTAVRVWLGTMLMRFAAWIIGCNVEIDTSPATAGSMVPLCDVPPRYDVNDPGYRWEVGRHLRVMLDGVEVSDVVAYDIAARTITRHAKDATGTVYIDHATERLAVETLVGAVTVDWCPAA